MKHNFNDGNGEVDAVQWKNGGGWVACTAKVDKTAFVGTNAWVSGNAQVYGDARVYGYAWVSGNARVYGYAQVSGNAQVSGDAQVYGDAQVSGNANIKKSPICISGSKWHITITNCNIAIGCELHTTEEWTNFTDKEISNMSDGALDWWNEWRGFVLSVAKGYQK